MRKYATCKECGNKFLVETMTKVNDPARKYFYLCNQHSTYVRSYTTANNSITKKQGKDDCTYGIELETCNYNVNNRRLIQSLYIPTYDGSIRGIEWKSPIMLGLNGLPKLLTSILTDGLKMDIGCGSHINVGMNKIRPNDFARLQSREIYTKVFKALYLVMLNNPEKTKQLCGRAMIYHYCSSFEPTDHSSFLTVRENRIELRVAKLINSKQYMKCIKFTAEILKCVYNNALKYRATSQMTEHKLSVTSAKLVRIYEKYTA